MRKSQMYMVVGVITALVMTIAFEVGYLLRPAKKQNPQNAVVKEVGSNPEDDAKKELIRQITILLESSSFSFKEADYFRNLLTLLSEEDNGSYSSTLHNSFSGKVISVDRQPGALSEIIQYAVKLEIQYKDDPIKTIYYTEEDIPKIQVKKIPPSDTNLTLSDIKPGDMLLINEITDLKSQTTTSVVITITE